MPFKPGVSGNPRGRPKSDFEIRDLCKKHGKDAVELWVKFLDHKNPFVALRASELLAERGYGKAAQESLLTVTHEAGDTLTALIDKIRARSSPEPLGRPIVEAVEPLQLPVGGGGDGDTLQAEAGADGPLDSPDLEATRTRLRDKVSAAG